MKNVSKFYLILIGILVVIIVLMRMFQPKPVDLTEYIKIGSKEYILLSQNIDTVFVDKVVEIPVYVPVPGKPIPQPLPPVVDTLSILKDYYSKYVYDDKIKIDSVGYAYIKDTVTQNKITSRTAKFVYKIPIITNTTIVKDLPKNQIYIGGGLGLDKVNLFNQVSGGFLLKTKSDKIYGLSIGVVNTPNRGLTPTQSEITPFISGSMYWKINLKK
jgi:hypothetical protein